MNFMVFLLVNNCCPTPLIVWRSPISTTLENYFFEARPGAGSNNVVPVSSAEIFRRCELYFAPAPDPSDNAPASHVRRNIMAATRTQGITVDTNGNFTIDKEHHGVRICVRLGPLGQRDAEQRLETEIARVEFELERKAASRPRFADCAARYLAQSQHKRSVSVVAWHIRLLYPYLGNLEVNRVHDRTLEPFIADRMAAGVTATPT